MPFELHFTLCRNNDFVALLADWPSLEAVATAQRHPKEAILAHRQHEPQSSMRRVLSARSGSKSGIWPLPRCL